MRKLIEYVRLFFMFYNRKDVMIFVDASGSTSCKGVAISLQLWAARIAMWSHNFRLFRVDTTLREVDDFTGLVPNGGSDVRDVIKYITCYNTKAPAIYITDAHFYPGVKIPKNLHVLIIDTD